jgi:hypothetical protein
VIDRRYPVTGLGTPLPRRSACREAERLIRNAGPVAGPAHLGTKDR